MKNIREFVRSGGQELNDADLLALVRQGMLMVPLNEQGPWLREAELILDAYGTKAQLEAAARVREMLVQLSSEIKTVRA